MSLFEYILIALAFGIEAMTVMRQQAETTPIRLTRGLAIAATLAAVYALLAWAGLRLGNLMRFEIEGDADVYASANTMVYLGMTLVVAVKMLIAMRRAKKQEPRNYNIALWQVVIALAVAMGVNVLIVSLGIGFLPQTDGDTLRITLPLLLMVFLLAYLGIMFGRQKVAMRERRWLITSLLLLLSVAVYRVVTL